jgi:hypothetical protein
MNTPQTELGLWGSSQTVRSFLEPGNVRKDREWIRNEKGVEYGKEILSGHNSGASTICSIGITSGRAIAQVISGRLLTPEAWFQFQAMWDLL